jgi:hypothetical protein
VPYPNRHAQRDAVQRAGKGVTVADRRRLARQDEKGRLERVLGVLRVGQDAAADAVHQRPVAARQLGERRLVAAGDEARQQDGVGGVVRGRGAEEGTDAAPGGVQCVRHASPSTGSCAPPS